MLVPAQVLEIVLNYASYFRSGNFTFCTRPSIIGERERANLVVQLARFFCLYIIIYPALMYAVMFYVILNKRKGRNFVREISRTQCLAHAQIYIASGKYISLRVRHLYYSWQVWVVGLHYTAVLSFACCWLAYTRTAIINFLLNSSIIFCRTLVGSLPLANNVQHSASYTNGRAPRPACRPASGG